MLSGISRVSAACILLVNFAGHALAVESGANKSHSSSDLTIEDAVIQDGRLLVSGRTAEKNVTVTLDGSFETNSGQSRFFTFSLLYLPTSCVVSVAAAGSSEPPEQAVVASCAARGLNPRGAWDPIESYAPDDVVTQLGSAWRALDNNVNRSPSLNPALWEKFVSKGDAGSPGPKGDAGPQGPTGPAGATGPQGPIGPIGMTGATGSQGPQGPTGATGPQGAQGAQGDVGPAGLNWSGAWSAATSYAIDDAVQFGGSAFVALQPSTNIMPASEPAFWSLLAQKGDQGNKGDQGDTGPAGATGQAGTTGPAGATGPQGPIGPIGMTGATGSQGPQGPTGATGPQGAQGAQGDVGPAGLNWSGSWSAATTYATDDAVQFGGSAFVALQPSTNKMPASQPAFWSLLAQKGEQGEKGEKGDQGDTGPAGATGQAGVAGPQGPTGATGATGTTGAPGPQGPAGAIGATGATGPQGPAGPNAVANGSLSAPSINFASSPNTGIFAPAPGKIALTENGFLFLHNSGAVDNTALGLDALGDNTTGVGNTALGFAALSRNISGNENLAVGSSALGRNTNGFQNIGIGPQALDFNVSGGRNTAVGINALSFNSTGENNIALGFMAGQNAGNQSNSIFIGNLGAGGDTATIKIGTEGTQTRAFLAGINGVNLTNNAPVLIDPATGQLGSSSWAALAATGLKGDTGATGPAGPQGATGPTGATGPQGPAGATGATGAQGPVGATGATGTQGGVGPQGPKGFNWRGAWSAATGYATADAVVLNGSSYIALADSTNQDPATQPSFWSLIAAKGDKGETGATGDTGPQGPAGATGATGAIGPQGPQGAMGATGTIGPQGPQGPVGPIGLTGTQGPQGDVGPKGLNWFGAWSAASNYAKDDAVARNGSSYIALADNLNQDPATQPSFWSLLAQKGDMGDTGNTGANGGTGPAGPQGPKGDKGDTGATGGAGAIGPQGPAGATGATGSQGPQGPAGPNTVANGSVTAPAINFTASPTTGIFSPEPGKIALAAGGNLFLHNMGLGENTALGVAALENVIAASNTAVGASALSVDTNGQANTAVGAQSLAANTIGDSNTAVGDSALSRNTEGILNTAVGASALSASTGNANTAVGTSALFNNTTGLRNTALGSAALYGNKTGGSNVAIGYDAGKNPTAASNSIFIGNQGANADTNAIKIGTQGTQTSAFMAGISGVTVASAAAVLINTSTGQLGTISSSRRYKEDIHTMPDLSAALMKLRPVTFRYKKPSDDGSKPIQYGLIAEEVAEALPYLTVFNEKGQPETVKYHELPTFLLAAYQHEHALVEAQAKQIAAQADTLAALQRRLDRIEAREAKAAAVQPASLSQRVEIGAGAEMR